MAKRICCKDGGLCRRFVGRRVDLLILWVTGGATGCLFREDAENREEGGWPACVLSSPMFPPLVVGKQMHPQQIYYAETPSESTLCLFCAPCRPWTWPWNHSSMMSRRAPLPLLSTVTMPAACRMLFCLVEITCTEHWCGVTLDISNESPILTFIWRKSSSRIDPNKV